MWRLQPFPGAWNGHWAVSSGQICNACSCTCSSSYLFMASCLGTGDITSRTFLPVEYSKLTSSIFQRQGKRINKRGRKLESVGFRSGVLRRASQKCEALWLPHRTLEIDLHLRAHFSYQNWNHVYLSTLPQYERPAHQLRFHFSLPCFQQINDDS
jgi:hypothetical protein